MDTPTDKAEPIPKETESPAGDQPSSKETGSVKVKNQNKCACDGPSSTKTKSSREDKMRKKDDKSVEHVLKALNSLNTSEEKLAAMCKKYADIFDENRKLQLALKQCEKQCSILQREKEQLQTEHSKSILTRSRLENLCRELQRQNKAIKDESLSKIREEEEKRKEVSAKFQSTLTEINHLMQQNNDKNTKLRDDNLDMNARLKSVCEQYELREQEVDRISKQMQLEAQLAEAKLAKAKMEMAAERELFIREKQQLLVEITQYQARCQEFQTDEINLRKQISLYNEKYDEFQRALAKSNEVFGGFKVEMDKMSKKILKLEKETVTWKQRWENSHQALLNMADDKQRTDQELGLTNRQLGALQGLCRTLQTERTAMLAKLKEAGIKNEQLPILTNGDVTSDVQPAKEQSNPTSVVGGDQNKTSSQSSKSPATNVPKASAGKKQTANPANNQASNQSNAKCSVVDSAKSEGEKKEPSTIDPCVTQKDTVSNNDSQVNASVTEDTKPECVRQLDTSNKQVNTSVGGAEESPKTAGNEIVCSKSSDVDKNQVPSSPQKNKDITPTSVVSEVSSVDKSQSSSNSSSIPLVPIELPAESVSANVVCEKPTTIPPADGSEKVAVSPESGDCNPPVVLNPPSVPDVNKKEAEPQSQVVNEKITTSSNSSPKVQGCETKKTKESRKRKK